jgi:hypothetical protein
MSTIEPPSGGSVAARFGAGDEYRAPAQPEAGRRFEVLLERAARVTDSHDARGTICRQVPDRDRDAEERPAARRRSDSGPSDHDPSDPHADNPSVLPPQPDILVVPVIIEFAGPAPSRSQDAPSSAPADRPASTDQPEITPSAGSQADNRFEEDRSALMDILALGALQSDSRIELQTPNLGRVTVNFSRAGGNPRFVVGVDPAFARSKDDMERWLDNALPGTSAVSGHAVVVLGPPAAPNDKDAPLSQWRRTVD